ncbi:MAG: winged helix-turn-helix domain-containing protein [Actinomycetota bacterium]|nr:winged helix-turn-helix domain-containing protein [Actinomycetota bacterium]
MPAALTTSTLTNEEARRIALAAQGFAEPRPAGRPDRRALRRVMSRVGLFQIDSVNVVVRSHYLPLFSRLGSYPVGLLDRAASQPPRELFEYWGHEASLIPVATEPLLRWRMAGWRDGAWGSVRGIVEEKPDFVSWVLAEVRDRGPLSAGEIEHDVPRPTGGWGWNWSEVKRALEWLFSAGRVTCAARRGFERLYDLPERVLPPEVIAAPTPAEPDAQRDLVEIAARCLGVATEGDLRDYFRLRPAASQAAVAALVESGRLLPVGVAGWRQPAYLHADARVPRRVAARALLSPFDSLVWERSRTERLFGMRLRLEIYTPAAKRVHGYYVLPFLLGDTLVARVDLKADRKAGVLQVPAAYAEAAVDRSEVAKQLAAELVAMAQWLGLPEVVVGRRGDLAAGLRAAF